MTAARSQLSSATILALATCESMQCFLSIISGPSGTSNMKAFVTFMRSCDLWKDCSATRTGRSGATVARASKGPTRLPHDFLRKRYWRSHGLIIETTACAIETNACAQACDHLQEGHWEAGPHACPWLLRATFPARSQQMHRAFSDLFLKRQQGGIYALLVFGQGNITQHPVHAVKARAPCPGTCPQATQSLASKTAAPLLIQAANTSSMARVFAGTCRAMNKDKRLQA